MRCVLGNVCNVGIRWYLIAVSTFKVGNTPFILSVGTSIVHINCWCAAYNWAENSNERPMKTFNRNDFTICIALFFNSICNQNYIYLKMTSSFFSVVCNSNFTGHCSQLASNSSLYPIRKYIFLEGIPCLRMPAIRMRLCWRLMMISEQNKSCQVPVMNRLMNTSSSEVSAALCPSSNEAKIKGGKL